MAEYDFSLKTWSSLQHNEEKGTRKIMLETTHGYLMSKMAVMRKHCENGYAKTGLAAKHTN